MPFLARFALAGVAVGAMLLAGVATASADDTPPPPLPPNCTAADLTGVMTGVAAATTTYLFTHPDVNAFFTSLKGRPKDEIRTELQAYMDANPQVGAELRAIRQPSVDFRTRCQ